MGGDYCFLNLVKKTVLWAPPPEKRIFFYVSSSVWNLELTHPDCHHACHSGVEDKLHDSCSEICLQDEDIPKPIYLSRRNMNDEMGDTDTWSIRGRQAHNAGMPDFELL